MNTYTVTGTYGSNNTACNVFVYKRYDFNWYVIEGSKNVNGTCDDIENGIDVEAVIDLETTSSNTGIQTEYELEAFINEEEEPEELDLCGIDSMTIEINDFGNQSLIDDTNTEVINMLQGIIKNIEVYGVLNCDGLYLRDINGNTVGTVSVTEQI